MNRFLLIAVSLHVAQCIIPGLVVKKLDKTLIAKKRQDTMEICRIFTEENNKMHQNHAPKIIKSYTLDKAKTRFKRDIKEGTPDEEDNGRVEESPQNNYRYKRATMKYAINPVLNPEDARRVENIVDKLYDDMEEKGQRVTYRQVPTKATRKKDKSLKPSRRFDFAPAELTKPNDNMLTKKIEPDDVPFESKARWKQGIVPYFIDFNTYDAQLSEMIVKAFDYVEKATCIRLQRLREKPTDKESLENVAWLYISNPTGIRQCVHSNEKLRVNGVLMSVIGYDCMSIGDIVHELMHILGYSHEHLRSDRDQHISILWDNIKPGYKKYFDLNIPGSEYDLESLPYDYTSILHYPPRAFSKNGKATILTESGLKIGQREGLSEIDVEKVALIYSNECLTRNREYLLQTCPSVVKAVTNPVNITQKEIEDYFKERLWSFGIIQYRFRDKMEFTVEERENLKAVFRHIEQETCLEFRDIGTTNEDDDSDENKTAILSEKEKDADFLSTTLVPNDAATVDEKQKEGMSEQPESKVDEAKDDTPDTHDEAPTTEVGLMETIAPDSDENDINPYDEENAKRREMFNKKLKHGRRSKNKLKFDVASSNENVSENQIQKTNKISGVKAFDFKNMNLTMKKELLKRAKGNKLKQQSRRYRRDTSSVPNGRRHANAILVLERSPDINCKCPEPGTPKGDKVLAIGSGCFNSANDLLHFFVHVLGLDHQHNMHDRDQYLHIVWENLTTDIRLEMENKLPPAASAGFSYDYQSVMHYPWLQIKNGKTNIMYPIWNDGWAMGHWQGLSSVDVQKLNLLYFSQCMDRQQQEKQ